MKVAGIIAEYNPFHNGHAHLVETARKNGATHVVAVMSGNFVQRGEPALFDRSVRTQAALMNGVDLVLQLPAVYAASGAQSFARAAVEILDGTGFIDELVRGVVLNDFQSFSYFQKVLKDKCIIKQLKKMGADENSIIRIKDIEFEIKE